MIWYDRDSSVVVYVCGSVREQPLFPNRELPSRPALLNAFFNSSVKGDSLEMDFHLFIQIPLCFPSLPECRNR